VVFFSNQDLLKNALNARVLVLFAALYATEKVQFSMKGNINVLIHVLSAFKKDMICVHFVRDQEKEHFLEK
jgi:hypothetical protein